MPFKKAGESRAFGAPGKYIQGPGELDRLPTYAKSYGDRGLLLLDPFFQKDWENRLVKAFEQKGLTLFHRIFHGECTEREIKELSADAMKQGAKVLIGIGGGKTLDTVKAAAADCGIPMIVCPTAISNDAATSSHSVVYREDRTSYNRRNGKNPDYVIADTDVIIQAPIRMLAAGMGDALATYIEARAGLACGNVNYIGEDNRPTRAGLAIARLAYDIILEKGPAAYQAAMNRVRTEAFEDLVEANTLLSGLGFENTSCSVAHGLQSALYSLPETAACLHGELVGFGTLVQLVVENRPEEEFDRLYEFYKKVSLPTSLDEIGITMEKREKVSSAVELGLSQYEVLRVEPFDVTKDRLIEAILFVDSLK